MERPRTFAGRRISIKDLIDDGADLAAQLAKVAQLQGEETVKALRNLIRPTLVVCSPGARCPHTGLKLQDIWRYFRLTWSLEYRPTPGRTLQILIRNEARPNSPIIGIAMLASPCSRLKIRDEWIGWTVESLTNRIKAGTWQPEQVALSLFSILNKAIGDIRSDDLVSEEELDHPTTETVRRLRAVAKQAHETRLRLMRANEGSIHERVSACSDEFWLSASAQPLFLKKRAGTLASLLAAKALFLAAGIESDPSKALLSLLDSARGRSAVETVLVEIRKNGLASGLLDVSVCGAVPPYNELIGGKLVALLLASREMQEEYQARYAAQVSLIASQLAGRPITRPARILVLTTTSLYGVGSSQYNRLVLRPSDHPQLGSAVCWHELGVTSGYGTTHLSRWTVESLTHLSRRVYGVRRINNIFGEGTSPRLRQIREGLEALGVDPDTILRHETPRIVYACEPVPRGREQLLGQPEAAPSVLPTVAEISEAWCRRWLINRIRRHDVLARIARRGKELHEVTS
ncbi:Druantia anti-phage system protein DruA [Symbiobacterium terraclitae]|uniref:Druantia anti-phage system protein DruA n=1 Tax=Symbiobacterium terraclitae TaxID=557451 RepID=UPI0035B53BCD